MNYLEVNANYVVKSERETLDNIDARCIDITAVRRDEDKRQNRHSEALMCRDKHHCEVDYLVLYLCSRLRVIQESNVFPLRDSPFEGLPVRFTYAYIYILEE